MSASLEADDALTLLPGSVLELSAGWMGVQSTAEKRMDSAQVANDVDAASNH